MPACLYRNVYALFLSFSRAPVNTAYNMFSPVNIFVYKNLPISFLKLRITGKSVVRYSFSSVVIRTQRTATIVMPSFRTSRHLQTEVHFRPAKPIISAQLPPYEIRQWRACPQANSYNEFSTSAQARSTSQSLIFLRRC